jgi:hypothetical protein
MPYNPGITDRSGELLAGGITKGADAWTEALAEVDRAKKETELMAPYVATAVKRKLMEPDALAQFATGTQSKRRELGASAQMALKDYFAEEAMNNERTRIGLETTRVGYEGQRVDLANREYQDAKNFQLSPEDQAKLKESRHVAIRLPGGHIQIVELPPEKFSLTPDKVVDLGNYVGVPTSEKGGYNFLPKPKAAAAPMDPKTLPRITVGGKEGVIIPDSKGGMRIIFPTGVASGTVQKPLGTGEAMMVGSLTQQLAKINEELAGHAAEISQGDNRYGFLNINNRQDRVAELLRQADGIKAQLGALQPVKVQPAAAAAAESASPRTAAPAATAPAKPAGKTSSANAAAMADKLGIPLGAIPTDVTDPIAAAVKEQEKAASNGKQAAAGYEVGRTYQGLTYLGGDPSDEANWKK